MEQVEFNVFTGAVVFIGDTQQITDTFSKRELHIKKADPSAKRAEYVCLECSGKPMNDLDKIAVGDVIWAKFSLGGRQYDGKVFNSLRLIELGVIEKAGEVKDAEPDEIEGTNEGLPGQSEPLTEDSDLPF